MNREYQRLLNRDRNPLNFLYSGRLWVLNRLRVHNSCKVQASAEDGDRTNPRSYWLS